MGLETVLVALDESDSDRIDEIQSTTVDIAEPAGAAVELVHVYTEEEYERATENLQFDDGNEATPDTVARRHATVRKVRNALESAGVPVTVSGVVQDGDEGRAITDVAARTGADLLVIGGEKRSPAGKAMFGSTAQQILLNAPCPVTYVQGRH